MDKSLVLLELLSVSLNDKIASNSALLRKTMKYMHRFYLTMRDLISIGPFYFPSNFNARLMKCFINI
jgi:hypothetical protein